MFQHVNNLPSMKFGFEKEMNMKPDEYPELFLQYYQAKMLDGIFNELSRMETIIQKLNWINDSLKELKKENNTING
jgi:hypothetical protein